MPVPNNPSNYGKSPEGTAWDFSAADYTIEQLISACTWIADKPKDELAKSDCKLPHHKPDGTLIWRGVSAAGNAIRGARGGVDIPSGDLDRVKAHLAAHYHEFERKAPWEVANMTFSDRVKFYSWPGQDTVSRVSKIASYFWFPVKLNPRPNPGEAKEEFLIRCMEDPEMAEFDDENRALICYAHFELSQKKHEAPAEMAGFDDEIEVFRAGEYPQATITERDLDDVVKDYSPEIHEAPVVIGHPEHNHPAFGWVEKLRRQGKTLLVKINNVVPEFAELVKQGLLKKRSASFLRPHRSPTGRWYLGHVGFLGAKSPEVKGLKDIAFADEKDRVEITFEQEEIDMTQEDIKKMVEAESKKAADAVRAEFTEKATALEAENKRLSDEAARAKERADKVALEAARRDAEIFCEGLIRDGKLTPGLMDMGLVSFMLSLEGEEATVEFAETGKDPQKLAPRAWLQKWLESMPKFVNFARIVGEGDAGSFSAVDPKTGQPVDPERMALHRKVTRYMEEHKDISYSQAYNIVRRKAA